MSPSSHTRGHRFAPEHTAAVLEWLELHGRRVVNPTAALATELSKVRQMAGLTKCGIRVPRTVVVTPPSIPSHRTNANADAYVQPLLDAAAKHFQGQSFIVKANRSGRGAEVRLFSDVTFMERYLRSPQYLPPIDGITLLQEYIKSPHTYITRLEFVDKQLLYAVRVNTSEGFELCPADHCSEITNFKTTFEILPEFRHPSLPKFLQYVRSNNAGVVAIEVIEDHNGELFAFDVNHNTNYNSSAEKKAFGGPKAMKEIALYLKRELDASLAPAPAPLLPLSNASVTSTTSPSTTPPATPSAADVAASVLVMRLFTALICTSRFWLTQLGRSWSWSSSSRASAASLKASI